MKQLRWVHDRCTNTNYQDRNPIPVVGGSQRQQILHHLLVLVGEGHLTPPHEPCIELLQGLQFDLHSHHTP